VPRQNGMASLVVGDPPAFPPELLLLLPLHHLQPALAPGEQAPAAGPTPFSQPDGVGLMVGLDLAEELAIRGQD